MRRRDFIRLLGAAAGVAGDAVWSLAARAQSASMPVIGFLGGATAAGYAKEIAWIREGLKDTDFVEGKNAAFEFRWADGKFEQLPALAADLISRNVAVIVTTSGPLPARAAKAATATIPIVFAPGGDPVAHGLVPAQAEWFGREHHGRYILECRPDAKAFRGYTRGSTRSLGIRNARELRQSVA